MTAPATAAGVAAVCAVAEARMLPQQQRPLTQNPNLPLLPLLLLFLLVVVAAVAAAVTAVSTAAAACTWHWVLHWRLALCCCLRPLLV